MKLVYWLLLAGGMCFFTACGNKYEPICDRQQDQCDDLDVQDCDPDNAAIWTCLDDGYGNRQWIRTQSCGHGGICIEERGRPQCVENETPDDDDDDEDDDDDNDIGNINSIVEIQLSGSGPWGSSHIATLRYSYSPDDGPGIGCHLTDATEEKAASYRVQAYKGPVDIAGDEVGLVFHLDDLDGPGAYVISVSDEEDTGARLHIQMTKDLQAYYFTTQPDLAPDGSDFDEIKSFTVVEITCELLVYEGEYSGMFCCNDVDEQYEIRGEWFCAEL